MAKTIRNKLKLFEELSTIRVRIVERTGEKIVDILQKSDNVTNRPILTDTLNVIENLVVTKTQETQKECSRGGKNVENGAVPSSRQQIGVVPLNESRKRKSYETAEIEGREKIEKPQVKFLERLPDPHMIE